MPMRVRPFFWFLLAGVCISVLLFATFTRTNAPAILDVALDQHTLVANGMTSLQIQLTDSQGLPIEKAQVMPSAKMTNMNMSAKNSIIQDLGHGRYKADLALNMSGPWAITIKAQATGFMTEQRTLSVQVV
jgi:YtkA-like